MRRRLRLAIRARQAGAKHALLIAREADRAKLPYSVAYALVEQESDFQNVFGHDPTIFAGAGAVTKEKVRAYLRRRGRHGQGGMQGVGLTQLTWWSTQDAAERAGGLHLPKYQLRIGFLSLAGLIRQHGRWGGFRRYNGAGEAAERYADAMTARSERWHRTLT